MTEQIKERLRYKGKTYNIIAEPLNAYLSKSGKTKNLVSPHTACWRGYYGTWKIKQDKLYLVKLKAFIDDYKEVGIDYLFPNKKEVFAEWFNGEIIIIDDDNTVLGYAFVSSISGDYLSLKFKNGELIKSERVRNKSRLIN